MYHDFTGGSDDSGNLPAGYGKLTKGQFEAHLKSIKNNFRPISVEEAIKEIRYGGGLKENSVAITFDDGYLPVYEIAFPLLKKYGLSATIYLPTDWIDGKITLWWEDLADIIFGFDVGAINRAVLAKIVKELTVELPGDLTNDRKSKEIFLQVISHELMKTSDERRKKIMGDLKATLLGNSTYKRTEVKPVNWAQIGEMAGAGIMFGAHTCSHLNLSHADLDTARDEIVRSKNEIESRLDKKISGFAFPYGYDVSGYARFETLLQELGFEYACTSWWGNNNNESNPFLLYRNTISPLQSPSLLGRELCLALSE